ncbi:MAG: NF038122 family metalloprotease [Acidobacteriota bacterium]
MKYPSLRVLCVVTLSLVLIFGLLPLSNLSHSRAATPRNLKDSFHAVESPDNLYMIRVGMDGEATCQEATFAESQYFRNPSEGELQEISPRVRIQAVDGLTITLRGTTQLDANPEAKDAFIRAAAHWEALIKSPITVVIDVDFGTTRFGTPYDPDVLGSTRTQLLGADGIYPDIREVMIEEASNDSERILYNALPLNQLPTDKGNSANIVAASSVLRAIGVIAAVADPAAEEPNFGAPPSIGFNSAFAFDFDPSNGVDPNSIDFDTVATHEIGHALGFTTMASQTQSGTPDVNIWDFFRFAPGITSGNFVTSPRILNSGGQHVFYAGGAELALSTGTTSQGGDGNQSSHWKADEITGTTVGIMDPTIARGRHIDISENDKAVLETIGHSLNTVAQTVGATINKTTFFPEDPSLSIKGSGFGTPIEIEINGVIVTPSRIKVKGAGAKLVVIGSSLANLNIVPGANTLRVRKFGVYSNPRTFNF